MAPEFVAQHPRSESATSLATASHTQTTRDVVFIRGEPREEDTNTPEGQGDSQEEGKPTLVLPPSPEHRGILTLSHDIHLHLPPTSDVSVYRAIFQAMKSELM